MLKTKLKLFGCCVLLTLHFILVYFVPGLPWYFVIKHGHDLGYILMGCITLFLQIPIMVYATTKENSIMERLVMSIRELHTRAHEEEKAKWAARKEKKHK